MKNYKGITRKMDALGRVCVPIEIRRRCNISPGDFVEMSENYGVIK